MVELRLDVSEDKLPEDCFISVRVGETQKLSRIAPTRSYQFPKAGERRYGKIEIYRRIGTVGVDVDPINTGERQVSVGCGDYGSLKLKVTVCENAKVIAQAPIHTATKKDDEKSKAAKEYLRQHSLELQLSEAMQAVLRVRPEDPVKFLADTLLKNLSQGAVALPPDLAKAPKVAAPKVAALAPGAPNVAAPAPTRTQASDLSNFTSYFKANFATAPQAAWDKIFSKFPARGPAAKTVAAAAPAAPMRGPFQLRPSVGSWLVKKPPPVKPVPSKAQVFARLPSVGTWLQRLPAEEQTPAKQVVKVAPHAPPEFKWKPSVGTWLVKPVRVKGAKPAPAKAKAEAAIEPLVLDMPTEIYPFPAAKRAHCVSSAVFGPSFMCLGLGPRMLFV